MVKRGASLLVIGALCFPASGWSDDELVQKKPSSNVAPKECLGVRSKTKRPNVPLFQAPELSSRVVATLSAASVVCVIGQDREFAIIDPLTEIAPDTEGNVPKVLFVRETELSIIDRGVLRGGPAPGMSDPLGMVRRWYERVQSGVVPEDGLAPYREAVKTFENHTPPSCANGSSSVERGCAVSDLEKDSPSTKDQGHTPR